MSKKNVTMPLRELPQSIAAEAAVLGSILVDPACFAEVAELICIEAFGRYENHWLYEALLRISKRGHNRSIDALLLHHEDYYHKGQAGYCNTNVADVIIAKQRNGPTGAIKLTFRPELSRFESYAMADAVNFLKSPVLSWLSLKIMAY